MPNNQKYNYTSNSSCIPDILLRYLTGSIGHGYVLWGKKWGTQPPLQKPDGSVASLLNQYMIYHVTNDRPNIFKLVAPADLNTLTYPKEAIKVPIIYNQESDIVEILSSYMKKVQPGQVPYKVETWYLYKTGKKENSLPAPPEIGIEALTKAILEPCMDIEETKLCPTMSAGNKCNQGPAKTSAGLDGRIYRPSAGIFADDFSFTVSHLPALIQLEVLGDNLFSQFFNKKSMKSNKYLRYIYDLVGTLGADYIYSVYRLDFWNDYPSKNEYSEFWRVVTTYYPEILIAAAYVAETAATNLLKKHIGHTL